MRFTREEPITAISNISIYVFMVLTAFVRIVNNGRLWLLLCTMMMLFAGFLNLSIALKRGDIHLFFWIAAACFCWCISMMVRNVWNYQLKYLVVSVAYVGIAYSFVTDRKNLRLYKLLYYAVAMYILVELVIFKVPIRTFMKDNTSYNYISVVLLFYLLVMNYLQWKEGEEFSYIAAGIFLAVAIVAYGRGGIVTALVYCAFLVFAKAMLHNREWKTYLAAAAGLAVMIWQGGRIFQSVMSSGLLDKFMIYGMEGNGRSEIWGTFINETFDSVGAFLVGGNPITAMAVYDPDGNLHNSFLQLYASFGFVFFALLMGLFVYSVIVFFRRKDLWMLMILFVFFVRAFTDKLMYRGYFEVIFYVIMITAVMLDRGILELRRDSDGNGCDA